MNLVEELKKLANKLENSRIEKLKEIENAQKLYKDDVLVNFKFEKQVEYSNLADEYEGRKKDIIDMYISNIWAGNKNTTTKEELSVFNEICKTIDNIGSFSEFELNAILDEVKDSIILMGMIERKIVEMNIIPEGVKVYEHFKIFEPIQEKRKGIRGIDEIKKFKDDLLFSHILQDTNFSIAWGIKMDLLENSVI